MDAAYACFLLLGMGALLPWNALITAADYWESRWPGRHTDRLVTVCYLPANLVVVLAMVAAHGAVRPRLRITTGLLGFACVLAAVVWMDAMPPSGRALAALLALVSACGVFDGLTSGALYGEAGVLAPRYTQAIATGNSAAGVIVSLLRAATKATLPPTPDGLRASAHLYFGLAAAACAACTLLYAAVLPRLPVVRRRREAALAACLHSYDELPFRDEAAEEEAGGAGDALETVASLRAATPAPRARHASVAAGLPRGHGVDVELSAEDPAGLGGGSAAEPLLGQQQQQQHGPPGAGSRSSRAVTAAAVLRRIWPLAAANAVIFIVTLSIFPGVLAEDLRSPALGSWYPIALIGAYNAADWGGKALPGWRRLRLRSEGRILGAALARALLIPLFRLAALRQAAPPAAFALTAALGLSNGFVCACAMMRAPEAAPPGAAALAGNLMVLFLVLGLCAGAGASFLWLLLPAAAA